ncbi:MAG: hypothetical protein PQJ61_05775 [Spirochaetales bacterium]|uniref:Uncharacterized protein n=1 Tax=Candidatus Thalassospirochaeta sargassi TaxID=3119039 RepID=A0AAJ1IED0_9SPIO|nr:hypothetical protein [Spirochaetales bacterium]
MNTKVNKAYFLIPVLYLAVIIFLLYMQFSGSSSFAAEVSGISIVGEKNSGAPGRDDVITELSIRSCGLMFSFGEENPALVYTQDGLIHNTVPEDYRVTASGIDIRLTKGLVVSFYRTQNDSDSLHISVSAGDPESIKYIHLPVIGEESQINADGDSPVLSVRSESLGNFFLTLPKSGTFNTEEEKIVLIPEREGASEIVLERTAGSGLDAFIYWISSGAELINAEELSKMTERYIADAADSLLGSRYNSTRGTWTMGTGVSSFSESALVMGAVETIGKPSYWNAANLLSKAAESHSRELTILSSSLFGNIVNEGWAYEQNLNRRTTELTRAARNSDYSIFTDPDLIAVVLTEDSDELIKILSEMIKTAAESEDTSLSDCLAIMSFHKSISEIYPDISSRFSAAADMIETVILPDVKVLDGRLYLSETGESADIRKTLTAGCLLISRIINSGDDDYEAVGRELIHSVLLLADKDGFLPAEISAKEGETASKSGIITPESIYPLITENAYYPAADYFFEETGKKISVLNQAEQFNIETTDFGYRMTFDFPADQTHMFAIRNIAPFYQMHLLGYKWNSDHRFLTYSSGWWYDRQHNTLFVKVKHRMKTEEILIYTDQPEVPQQPAAGGESENNTDEEESSSGGGL